MNLYDIEVTKRDGSTQKLAVYQGKVMLIVNTATGCGFTPQYEDLEALYHEFHDAGLEILDFPCNQFAEQAAGSDDEIHQFCTLKFNTEFDQFKKVEVNGEHAHPLFVALAAEAPFKGFGKGVKSLAVAAAAKVNNKKFGDKVNIGWNFTKFLIGKDGQLIARFEPTQSMADVRTAIESALKA